MLGLWLCGCALPNETIGQNKDTKPNLSKYRNPKYYPKDPFTSLPAPVPATTEATPDKTPTPVEPRPSTATGKRTVRWQVESSVREGERQRLEHNQRQETVPGYRVQIHSGTRREAANSALLDFSEQFPDAKVYLVYEPPYFKVRAGNFYQRLDAQVLYQQIVSKYIGAFIVPDQIPKR
jgi:hypothetical protein